VQPGPPVSAPYRATPLPLTPSRTHPLPIGPRYRRSRPSAACARVARTPPPSPVAQHWRHPRPPAGGRCRPHELSPSTPGPPLSSPFSPPRAPNPGPPSFFPRRPAHPSAFKSHRPPTSLPFLSIFLLHPLRAPLPPSSPLTLSTPSPGRLTASPSEARATPGVVTHKWCAPHPIPSPPALQDPATSATHDRSTSATMGHRHVASAPPPHDKPLLR
jgi:hypothetical protein